MDSGAIRVFLVIDVHGREAQRQPLSAVLTLLSTALAENGNNVQAAEHALIEQIQRLMAQC